MSAPSAPLVTGTSCESDLGTKHWTWEWSTELYSGWTVKTLHRYFVLYECVLCYCFRLYWEVWWLLLYETPGRAFVPWQWVWRARAHCYSWLLGIGGRHIAATRDHQRAASDDIQMRWGHLQRRGVTPVGSVRTHWLAVTLTTSWERREGPNVKWSWKIPRTNLTQQPVRALTGYNCTMVLLRHSCNNM